MSPAYRILYAIGFTSWERIAEPPVADQIADLFVREETGREPPYGTALDLGCGSGILCGRAGTARMAGHRRDEIPWRTNRGGRPSYYLWNA